ncbi:MAG: M23 family metallopeptidase [Candidatus Heimdallarchaeota archaeon]
MKIETIPSDFVINGIKKPEDTTKVISDIMLLAIKIENNTEKEITIKKYKFDFFINDLCIKTESIKEDNIKVISKEVHAFLSRFTKADNPVKKTANAGVGNLMLGNAKFWKHEDISESNVLKKGQQNGLQRKHFQMLESEPITEIKITVKYLEGEKEKKESITLPVKEYRTKNDYIFPLKGNWVVINNWDVFVSHRGMHSQEFAFDLVQLDENESFNQIEELPNDAFGYYGKEIIAIGDGTVVDCYDGIADNPSSLKSLSQEELINYISNDGYEPTVAGNYVIIQHENNEYSFYAHIIKGEVKVKKGDKIKQGQVIGLLGNSGNSTGPHLHFHLMNDSGIFTGRGLPCHFTNITNAMLMDIDFIENDRTIVHTK